MSKAVQVSIHKEKTHIDFDLSERAAILEESESIHFCAHAFVALKPNEKKRNRETKHSGFQIACRKTE